MRVLLVRGTSFMLWHSSANWNVVDINLGRRNLTFGHGGGRIGARQRPQRAVSTLGATCEGEYRLRVCLHSATWCRLTRPHTIDWGGCIAVADDQQTEKKKKKKKKNGGPNRWTEVMRGSCINCSAALLLFCWHSTHPPGAGGVVGLSRSLRVLQ